MTGFDTLEEILTQRPVSAAELAAAASRIEAPLEGEVYLVAEVGDTIVRIA